MNFMRSFSPVGLLVLRFVVGLIFLVHGYPKLVHPTPAMHDFFVSHGLPGYFVNISAILECFGSVLFFAGLFTRPAALLLAGEMAIAIWKVHSAHGIMAVKDYEFPLTLAAACFVLATVGPGQISGDHLCFGENVRKRRVAKSSED